MKLFLLGIAMLIALCVEVHRLGGNDSDHWMVDLPLEKLFVLQRCVRGAIFLLFVGAVMAGSKP